MAIKEKLSCKNLKWIDVNDPSNEEMENLSKEYNLNQHTVRDCMQPEHLPKYEFDDDMKVHFLILRFYAHSADNHMPTIQELTNKIAIFCTDELLITIHKMATPFLDPIARRLSAINREVTANELLAKIVWQALETYDEPATRLSEQLDFYESQVLLKKESNDITTALYYIKRQSTVSHKVLMLMLEPINHINVREGEEGHLLQDVRDQHLKMQTLYGQLMEEVNNLLNISMSFAAQRTNDVMRILTVFSVFFMPLTFIVGIYGMNFKHMPELAQRYGYPGVMLFMALVAAAIYYWFRKKGYL